MEARAALALDSLRRGQAAFGAGDLAGAAEWFGRGLRYAPGDGTVTLSLASVALARGDPATAERLFAEVTRLFDAEAAWLGLAAARLRLGDLAGALAAASTLLRRFAVDPGGATSRLVERLVAAGGVPGWCGLTPDGALLVRPGRPRARPQVEFDGVRVARPLGPVPAGVATARLSVAGVDLLGSPVAVAAQRAVEGWVERAGDGLRGWVWFPGNAARTPALVVAALDRQQTLPVLGPDPPAPRALMRPRGFTASAADLANLAGSGLVGPGLVGLGLVGPLVVMTQAGQLLAGCPLDFGSDAPRAVAVAAAVARVWPLRGPGSVAPADLALAGSPVPRGVVATLANAPGAPHRPTAIVVPVFRGAAETAACLDALVATVPPETPILVVDDASPEPDLAAMLDVRAAAGLITLHRLPANLGFPAAANHGLRAAAALDPRIDLVLLNSDTVPAPGWLAALRRAVHGAPDVGSATPLSNDASIMSYPAAGGGNAMPGDLAAWSALCATVAGETAVDLPTAVGFCVYLRRECLDAAGVFRADSFAQGYGEENDWSLRAQNLGWRHVGVPGAFVAHVGGRSFGAAREALTARNLAVLEALHPGYRRVVATWMFDRDPLRPVRRALDLARLAARPTPPATLLITHDGGGGVERHIEARASAIAAGHRRPLVLRPVVDGRPAELRSELRAELERRYRPGLWRLEIMAPADPEFPNLVFAADDIAGLADTLRRLGTDRVEVHHLLGHDPRAATLPDLLDLPYRVVVHDHSWFCARITTVAAALYCGEPELAGCVACVADHGGRLEETISPVALVARSARTLAGASAVVVPCADAATRLRRHFPQVRPQVVAHGSDGGPLGRPAPATPSGGEVRVCVVGAIGVEKGFDVLLGCARDAAARALDLSFHVVGHTTDDARLLDTGRVAITGPFAGPEAAALIREQRATLGLLPSIWPETWCYALTDLWSAGLMVAVFDIGAQAERVRATGRGWLLPLGMPARAINAALLVRARPAEQKIVMNRQ